MAVKKKAATKNKAAPKKKATKVAVNSSLSKAGKKGAPDKGERRGGRQKGTPNKKTQVVVETLENKGCDPVAMLADIAMGKSKCASCNGKGKFKLKGSSKTEICPACKGIGADIVTIDTKVTVLKELAQYVAPKRKAIEHTGKDDGDLNLGPKRTLARLVKDHDTAPGGV